MNPMNYIIKINLYGKGDTEHQVDKVVYYRYDFPYMMIYRWRWYFEYIAALVKVHYPHRKVELIIEQNSEGYLAGRDYIEKKTKSLLSSLRSQLTRLEKGAVQDDLFNTVAEKNEAKKERIRKEIADLESGVFTRWVPDTYKNIVKEVLHNTKSTTT